MPDDPDASWQPLTRHMSAVGRIGLASPVLEEYGTGRWRRITAGRDLVLLATPRVAGSLALPVLMRPDAEVGWIGDVVGRGYAPRLAGGVDSYLVLTPGSFVYRPEGDRRGTLLRVTELFTGAGGDSDL